MSDMSMEGDVMRKLWRRAPFQSADDREPPPADDANVRPTGWREPPLAPPSLDRDDAAPGPRPRSRRRLPTGLY